MNWTTVVSKKHGCKTLPEIIFDDLDYFIWGYETGAFINWGASQEEVELLYKRATAIKIPESKDGDNYVVEYTINSMTHRLDDVKLVPRMLAYPGPAKIRCDYFDLTIPRVYAPYDKSGNRIMIKRLKHYLFGSESYKMTKARCEEFFNNESLFLTD